ncbi:MAG: putative quinol monooxygenase [Gammaproteobacteria bacterium]
MNAFIARLVVKEGKEKDFEDLQRELSRLTHKHEPDTLVYDVIKHREEPRTYVVYSTFKDEAAFKEHMESKFHDELVPGIMECLAEDMDLQFFDAI